MILLFVFRRRERGATALSHCGQRGASDHNLAFIAPPKNKKKMWWQVSGYKQATPNGGMALS